MLKYFIFVIGIAKVLALKCHVCENFDTALCYSLERAENKFLKKCPNDEDKCALLVGKTTDPLIVRSCVDAKEICDLSKYNCKFCSTDGCNTGNEVEKPMELPDVDILMSNIYGVAVIGLLLILIIIWCLIRMCSKKEEEYEEDDCDEYYENETNIDLE